MDATPWHKPIGSFAPDELKMYVLSGHNLLEEGVAPFEGSDEPCSGHLESCGIRGETGTSCERLAHNHYT